MPKYKPLYSLYKGLRESKYDVPDSYVSFQKTLTQAGDAGAKSRRGLYQSLKDSNYDVPDTYEDFYKNLFVPVNSTTSRALKIGENPNTPTVNRYRQKMFDSVDPNKNGLNNLSNRAVGQAVRATNNVRKPVIAKVVNQKGKPTGKEFAITPAKTAEDLDREYAQETTKNWENELHDQIADADKDAAKISDMFKSFIGSTDEVGSVWGNMTRGGGIAGTPHSVTTNNGILENTETRQILAAGDYNRKRRELLQLEQDSRNGAIFDNHSFFRGMYDAAKDTGFLTGGASDLINAGSLLATKQDLDNGVHTEAGDMLMQQAVRNSNAQSQYGDNQGWMYTGGVITTNMAPFMVQIGSAGFSEDMSNAIGKVVQGTASKVALGTMEKATGMAGAHIANYIGKVTGLTTKTFGKAIQYGIVGAAQANTVGLGNVANDVINRYTGQVYQDEQGNYKFGTFDSDGKLVHEGGEDFLTALVKGDAAQTIEFATELAGGGIDAAGTALKNFVTKGGKKIINKYNMENVSKVIDFLLNNKVSKNARYLKAGADRTLGKVELNSIVGESLEEELGIIANTVFTGDNKISDLWDEKQLSQIWGGMLLSIGLMKGAVAPFYAYNAKQYYSYKHKLDKADVNLSQLLGKEKWEELRNQIDATTNDDMPEMVNKINRDVALGKNRQPVREYIQNLLIMRGYDIGNMLAAKKAVEDKGEGVSVKNMEKNQAYQQGRDAYGYDTHEIQLDQEEKQKSLAQLLGISEQQLASMSDEELEALSGRDDNIDRAIYDYQLSTARYEGVIDNARDQIDLEVQRAAQAVDMYTDKSRNTIRNATIKATGGLEDYGVYIINGNIATHEDGSIDISNSDDMILYYDPTTNTVEHADAMMFAELGSEENADEVRSQAMADAKEKAIKETTGIIDGVVEVGTQFKTVDADGTEHTYEVLADNGDGTAMITIDGNIPTELVKGENVNVPVSFEELQKMKDESDQQRLQAAKAQREQMEKERAEQQMQAQTTQAENPAQEDNIQSAPIEDNLDYSDIIRKDGKVQMVDVSDKDGNNLFPDAKDVFYIQGNKMRTKFAYIDANGELKTQSFPTGLVKIKTRGEVSVDDYKKYRNMILSAESSAMPETSMIEDNSGSIEADRGGIEVEDNEEGKLLNRNDDGAQTEQNQPSASVTTSQEDAAGSSESKDTNISANGNENNESLTFEDGTPIPVDVSGETDLSQTDASHAAEWYDNNLGEDADDWLDGEIKKAKKVLEQAKNKKLTGTKPSELVASKKEKEAAIADAQAHYDSAISIRDALKERRIAKEEDTFEGRKNLIEKARRKFARLKSAVKDDAEAVSQLYRDTIGSLLHRLYDSTGIDVTDTTPLTAEEYVASNLGAHSLNYEGTETSKGVKQETGLSREDFAKTQLLAADGKGTTIDALVHRLWENRPSNLESLDTQDIRNALIGVLNSGFKASEVRNFVENIRIAQAENILEEQKKAADNAAFAEENKAESEQQTETAPESEEKTGEENSDEINDEENEKINEQTNENINAPEVPEDATDEKPLGEQISKDKVPFKIEGGKSGETYDINDKEDRKRLVAENSVDDKDILDIDMPKHVHKAIKELCKKMGLKVQFLYMGAELNGWIENGTMYLALDANKAIQFVFGHEMTHAIKQKNPEAYKELVKVAMAVTTRKEFEEDLAKVYRIYHNASGYNNIDDFVEEVIADNIGKFINDHDLAQRFVLRLNHPVLATILHAIQKIKGLLYGDPYKSVDALERIVEKAYVDTANGQVTNSETGEDVSFSLRQKPEPKKKGIGYKVFVLKDGKLYPPMVANPDGAATPVGVWLDADAAPIAGESKTGRPQVKQGGKGTQGGSGKLAYRPGWHLGVVPYAIQFNRKDAEGNKTLFPKNFVFAEVEYAADVDYQEEARQEGINPSGKYQHSLAGLKHLPTDGYYMYRTNPNPETDPWVITGAMKVNRILTRAEQAELVKKAGREPQQIQEGDIVTDDVVNSINQEIADAPKFSLKDIKPVGVGAFGNIYNQFRGNAKAAIEFLKKIRGGEAVGALHHKDIGDIDLVWGKEGTGHSDGYGLSKLVKYHPEVLDNLQEILNDMRVVSSSKNRVNLESETHKAGVRLTWDGERKSWLLTAFKKETSASDKRTDTAATSLEGDTALSQTEGSVAKIDNSSETAKENGEKFSLKDEKIKSVAEKFGVNEDDVAMYANAVERGSTAEAARARANIKRYLLQANEDKISSFKELMKYTVPVNKALKENFGDLDAMIEERRKQVEAERNAMEAARKRAQEEEEKRQKHLYELSLIPTDELDKRYMDAIANNDESTAREMLDESARRNGYGDVDSDYQGQGAWAAPSNPQYESDEARRADIENSPDVNLEDIALGYNLQPDDYFDNPRAYMNNTAYGLESAHVIKNALDAIKNGEKDVKVKVYRAVPTSVKEGKLRNGDWVTPSKKYAEMHGDNRLDGKYRIIEDEVPANQLWWDGNDVNEFGFDDGKEYRYKNAKNNRKLNDLITYDNKGNVIPPSKRFNSRKSDIRFSLRGSTPYDKQMEEWMEKNHLEKGAVPMEKPIMKEGENIFDYANRMVEWTRNQNLWKTAPKQTGFQDALDKWKADNGLSPDAYPPVRPHREYYSSEIGYAEDLEEYNKKKELWKSAPKPKDFDLSVDLEDMNKQLRNIRRAVLNQKNYDQRTVKAVSDLVRKMLNIGWGDGLSRGKVGNLLSAAKNATGANDVKKYLDKAMGILAENYLNRLSTAYDNLINTKGARADQSGVIKMGSLDAKGQAFMSEYKKAINMDDKSLNNYIANIEEDSAKNEDNVEMNDYRLAGIQAAIMYKQQIGGNDADIAELKKQIGELKNKKDATKEDKDLLKSLEKKLFENKFDRITMYENLLNNIQRIVKESKGRANEFREEITEHKNEILHRANLDLEGVDSTYYDTTTAKKKLVNNDLQRAVFSSTYTFEQFLKFFGKKAANGEGYLYNYFTKLNQDALDEEQLYNEMNRNALDEKTKELFGKEKFMKLVGIDGKGMKEMDVEVTDYSNKETGKRTIHLKQGQMLYIYLVNKETDGEMKLRAMGITEEDVAAIEENLDPRVKAMGEWLQDEYLPECQRRYQATHTKYFGAPMKDVENYFPLAINNRARNVKEDVNQDSDAMSQLAGTSTGAIVTRRVNVIPLDIENADAFEVAFNHLQEMEEWSAMLPFRQDINTLLSYTHFRNQVQNMTSVAYGSGKTLWNEFKQTAQIAAGTYKPKVNAGMMDSRIAAAMGGIAVAKISGRLWTAIKQSQSATVFLPECDFTRFVKNGVNPYGSWKWAMENIPDFRKRVENMTYGDVKLRQYLDELEKWHDWTKTISKIGMAPNILVDGITCAVGARSVYETEVNRLTKLGYPKEKAEEKAYYKAVAAYNKTQQSSGGMYLSPMQVDRTYVSAALSLFKNANYAYGRMQIEACRGLARTYDFWGGKHKTTLIESMTRQIMEEDGLDENTARAIAKATYNRTFRQSIGRLINFATLVPVSWALYKVLPYLLTGDDDDKKKDMIEEAVLKGFATSLSDNYVIPFASNILNAGLKVEDGKPTFDPEVFRYQNLYINPATSDLANIYSMVGNQKWYSVANKLGMLGVQSLIGFNPETVGALYQAFSEADYDNGNTAKEWQIGILKAISAPEESIRELYIDELGLKSGDIKKIPLAELEKRYAERQINRDNLLSQIGMDAETFNGYVDKYQKSFEKKIKDKMDKWDEYDKKKADEFFDTTSDHKLKDMIEKKRTKDANAAADEQIAKEGLNQEKNGKEPSEEAYDAVKMSIDVAEDNAISTYNKVLYKRYAALNDEYNNQTDAMKYIFMNKHPNFKAYKDLESEYTTYGKKMKELKEKLVSAGGYDAKQTIMKQIRAEREKFSELQSKVR